MKINKNDIKINQWVILNVQYWGEYPGFIPLYKVIEIDDCGNMTGISYDHKSTIALTPGFIIKVYNDISEVKNEYPEEFI